MLNPYLWELYLQSGGSAVVEMFKQNLSGKSGQITPDYAEKVLDLYKHYCPSRILHDDLYTQLIDLASVDISVEDQSYEDTDPYQILAEFKNILLMDSEEKNYSDVDLFCDFSDSLAYYSTMLTIMFPDAFCPYYFQLNFNVFEIIGEEFGIELKEIPPKKGYLERYFYYATICQALMDFKKNNRLNNYELYAFLYDFAPKYIGGYERYIVNDLPDPATAYLIGGGKDDHYLSMESGVITPWQCHPDTKAGDMILMYLTSPVSAIDSIWRSVSLGFNDPFFYYYRCTYIGLPEKIKPLPLREMASDQVLKQMPIIRKNMQGLNGVEFKPSEYNRILDLTESSAIRLNEVFEGDQFEIETEKDVEKKLIIPLLEKMGYDSSSYKRQYIIPVGNNNRLLIPDFVIQPRSERGRVSCFAIIEAKLSISIQKSQSIAKSQVHSYSRQLRSQYAALASREGIWIYEDKDDYHRCIFESSWDFLMTNHDLFSQLKKIIGFDPRT